MLLDMFLDVDFWHSKKKTFYESFSLCITSKAIKGSRDHREVKAPGSNFCQNVTPCCWIGCNKQQVAFYRIHMQNHRANIFDFIFSL
jgi:hypothetical protein